MPNNSNPIPRKILLQRFSIAIAIVTICILFSLYQIGFLKLPFIESLRFKFILTVLIICAVAIYLFVYFVFQRRATLRKISWKTFTFFSFLFEGLGFWWVDTLLGKILIGIGFIFLSFGLISEYRK